MSRVLTEQSGIDCPARTVKEEVLQAAVVRAVNDAWDRKNTVIEELRENNRSSYSENWEEKLREKKKELKEKQVELLGDRGMT